MSSNFFYGFFKDEKADNLIYNHLQQFYLDRWGNQILPNKEGVLKLANYASFIKMFIYEQCKTGCVDEKEPYGSDKANDVMEQARSYNSRKYTYAVLNPDDK